MPPRWLSLLIVLFWLTTSAVFFWREYWPYLEPEAPPPFTIDLLDETHNPLTVRWKVLHNNQHVLNATTSVEHRAKENDFTLRATYMPPFPAPESLTAQSFKFRKMVSDYRVNPEGHLLYLETTFSLEYEMSLDRGKTTIVFPIDAKFWGDVKDGQFTANYRFALPTGVQEGKLHTVKVSSQGAVMLPLQPLNHIRQLRPGQSWRIPFVDPLDDALNLVVPHDTTYLHAKVVPQARMLELHGRQVECFVIEYSGDEVSARTWVRCTDEVVVQQEVTRSNDTWSMQRE